MGAGLLPNFMSQSYKMLSRNMATATYKPSLDVRCDKMYQSIALRPESGKNIPMVHRRPRPPEKWQRSGFNFFYMPAKNNLLLIYESNLIFFCYLIKILINICAKI